MVKTIKFHMVDAKATDWQTNQAVMWQFGMFTLTVEDTGREATTCFELALPTTSSQWASDTLDWTITTLKGVRGIRGLQDIMVDVPTPNRQADYEAKLLLIRKHILDQYSDLESKTAHYWIFRNPEGTIPLLEAGGIPFSLYAGRSNTYDLASLLLGRLGNNEACRKLTSTVTGNTALADAIDQMKLLDASKVLQSIRSIALNLQH